MAVEQLCVYCVLLGYFYSARRYRLQPNVGFTLRRVLAVFMRSAVIPPKLNRFGWNLEHSWVHCQGLALADFGRDPRSSDSCTARWIFCLVSNDFTDFSSAKFDQIWTQHVNRCGELAMKIFFGTEFWKLYHNGVVFPKMLKFFEHF